MEIKTNVENKLLNRKEIKAFHSNNGGATLTKKTVKSELAKKLKVDEKLIVLEKVEQHFGSDNVSIHAYVYPDETKLKKATHEYLVKRNSQESKKEGGSE